MFRACLSLVLTTIVAVAGMPSPTCPASSTTLPAAECAPATVNGVCGYRCTKPDTATLIPCPLAVSCALYTVDAKVDGVARCKNRLVGTAVPCTTAFCCAKVPPPPPPQPQPTLCGGGYGCGLGATASR